MSDQKQAHLEFFLDGCQQGQDLGLNRYVEGCGRLIGNNQTRAAHEAHGDHHALTQAPRKLVRILFQARSGRGNTHFSQQMDRPLPGLSGGYILMLQNGFFQLVADGVAGIQGSHGLLEDHGHAAPPNAGHGRRVGPQQILALENQLVRPTNAPGRQKVHDGQGGHGLAAAGFAHQAQGLTLIHAETDVAHSVQRPRRQPQIGMQPFDFQQLAHDRPSGAVTSRSPSPRRFMPNTRINKAIPGMEIR